MTFNPQNYYLKRLGDCNFKLQQRNVHFTNAVTTFGRDIESNVQLRCYRCSMKHCKVLFEDGRMFVEDVGSSAGTIINDVKFYKEKVEVFENTIIGMGADPNRPEHKNNTNFYIYKVLKVEDPIEILESSDEEDTSNGYFNNIQISSPRLPIKNNYDDDNVEIREVNLVNNDENQENSNDSDKTVQMNEEDHNGSIEFIEHPIDDEIARNLENLFQDAAPEFTVTEEVINIKKEDSEIVTSIINESLKTFKNLFNAHLGASGTEPCFDESSSSTSTSQVPKTFTSVEGYKKSTADTQNKLLKENESLNPVQYKQFPSPSPDEIIENDVKHEPSIIGSPRSYHSSDEDSTNSRPTSPSDLQQEYFENISENSSSIKNASTEIQVNTEDLLDEIILPEKKKRGRPKAADTEKKTMKSKTNEIIQIKKEVEDFEDQDRNNNDSRYRSDSADSRKTVLSEKSRIESTKPSKNLEKEKLKENDSNADNSKLKRKHSSSKSKEEDSNCSNKSFSSKDSDSRSKESPSKSRGSLSKVNESANKPKESSNKFKESSHKSKEPSNKSKESSSKSMDTSSKPKDSNSKSRESSSTSASSKSSDSTSKSEDSKNNSKKNKEHRSEKNKSNKEEQRTKYKSGKSEKDSLGSSSKYSNSDAESKNSDESKNSESKRSKDFKTNGTSSSKSDKKSEYYKSKVSKETENAGPKSKGTESTELKSSKSSKDSGSKSSKSSKELESRNLKPSEESESASSKLTKESETKISKNRKESESSNSKSSKESELTKLIKSSEPSTSKTPRKLKISEGSDSKASRSHKSSEGSDSKASRSHKDSVGSEASRSRKGTENSDSKVSISNKGYESSDSNGSGRNNISDTSKSKCKSLSKNDSVQHDHAQNDSSESQKLEFTLKPHPADPRIGNVDPRLNRIQRDCEDRNHGTTLSHQTKSHELKAGNLSSSVSKKETTSLSNQNKDHNPNQPLKLLFPAMKPISGNPPSMFALKRRRANSSYAEVPLNFPNKDTSAPQAKKICTDENSSMQQFNNQTNTSANASEKFGFPDYDSSKTNSSGDESAPKTKTLRKRRMSTAQKVFPMSKKLVENMRQHMQMRRNSSYISRPEPSSSQVQPTCSTNQPENQPSLREKFPNIYGFENNDSEEVSAASETPVTTKKPIRERRKSIFEQQNEVVPDNLNLNERNTHMRRWNKPTVKLTEAHVIDPTKKRKGRVGP